MARSNAATEVAVAEPSGSIRPGGWDARLVRILAVLALCGEVSFLAYVYPLNALADIAQTFRTDQLAWVGTVQAVVGGMTAGLIGNLADRFGKKRVLLCVLGLSILGMLVGAMASSFSMLLAARALQGPTLAVVFLAPSIIRDVFPTKILPFAMSVGTTASGVLSIGASFLVGGLVADYGFRGTFAAPAIFTVVVFALIWAVVPKDTAPRSERSVDVVGALLLGLGVAALLAAVSLGGAWGWTSPSILIAVVAGLAFLAVWVARSLKIEHPLVDLRQLANRPAAAMVVFAAAGTGASVWFFSFMPLVVTGAGDGWGLGLDPGKLSVFLAAFNAATFVAGFLAGAALSRLSVPVVAASATSAMAGGYLILSIGLDSQVLFLTGLALIGIASGFIYAVMYGMVVLVAVPAFQASVASVVNVCSNLGAAVTGVVVFAVMNAQGMTAPGVYSASAMTYGCLLPAGIAVVALLFAVSLLRRRDDLHLGTTS